MDSKYCYPFTEIFKNKFDIKDKDLLTMYEIKFATARMAQLSQKPIIGNFDYLHLKKIHDYIFQDLFSWAGQQRNVNISKGNSFCDIKYIESYINELFYKLKKENYMIDKPFDYKVKRLSYYFSEINATHPFREGNGRTQREFIKYLGSVLGVDLQFRTVTAEAMIKASIYSFNIDNSLLDKMFTEISEELPITQQIYSINKICIKDGDFLNNETVKEFISFKINEHILNIRSDTTKLFYEDIEGIDEYEKTTSEKKVLMELANEVAEIAHFGQTRDEGTPYIDHPKNVYRITQEITGGDDETSCIYSLLHDVLEDCVFISEKYLENCFGSIVLNDIKLLTKKKGEELETYLTKISKDEFVSFIKVCDRIDNIRSLKNTSKDKRKKYLNQTKNIFIPIFERVSNSEYIPLIRAIELLKKEVKYYRQ